MNASPAELALAIAGSRDFVRRMNAAARTWAAGSKSSSAAGLSIQSGGPDAVKSLTVTQRSDILVIEIGRETTPDDLNRMHQSLCELRARFQKGLYVIVAATAPERFGCAGSLLFADSVSIEPSGLVDNFIAAAPFAALAGSSIEEQLGNCLELAAELLESSAERRFLLPPLWDRSWVPTLCDPKSRETWMRWLPRYARYTSENPIIVGPTGTGKTRMAAALHLLSGRDGPFVSITPRDFSSMELVQAELFGAVQGAYTGAVDKWGLVKRAERGTLFIDELQSIDLELQGKLITFIENKTYRRVGESTSHAADVRFIFASNRPLDLLVQEGKLRDDFAYRLERLQLLLPALSERRLDIAAGLCFAVARISRERDNLWSEQRKHSGRISPILGFTPEAYAKMFGAPWPGNLRQLENAVARALEFAHISNEVLIGQHSVERALDSALGKQIYNSTDVFSEGLRRTAEQAAQQPFDRLDGFLASAAFHVRRAALEQCGGNADEAAKLIDDSPSAMALLGQNGTTFEPLPEAFAAFAVPEED